MTSTPRQDVRIGLKLSQQPTYVHPPRTVGDEGSSSSSLDKVITGDLTITTEREIRIGPIKVAWELGHHPHGGERTAIRTFVSDVTVGDQTLEEGVFRLVPAMRLGISVI